MKVNLKLTHITFNNYNYIIIDLLLYIYICYRSIIDINYRSTINIITLNAIVQLYIFLNLL